MNCAKSLELLSEFHDNALAEEEKTAVHNHLSECPPCEDVLNDLDRIVIAASILKIEPEISFPDENVFWHRLSIVRRTIH